MTTTLPRRRSLQTQQEQISRHQFSECIEAYGWAVGKQEADLGEDLIVHIYFDGRASGVTFHVQLKSITRLDKETAKPDLAYPFRVHDLLHWESFLYPVALVVWDTKLGEGRWILVRDAIAQLDQENPAWRSNKSDATVHIPHANDTSEAGLVRLRIAIAQHLMPLLMHGRTLEVNFQFQFPDTEEGRRESEKVRKAFEEGEPLDLDGQFIHSFAMPNHQVAHWLMFGDHKPSRFELGSTVDANPRPVSIELRGRNGQSVEFDNVLFHTTKQGTKQAVLKSDPLTSPVAWTITFRTDGSQTTFSLSWNIQPGRYNVATTHKLLRMMDILAAGGWYLLTSSMFHAPIVDAFAPCPVSERDDRFVKFVENLHYVQNVTGISILIPEEGSVAQFDIARRLYRVLTTGYDEPLSYPEFALPAINKARLAEVYAQYDPAQEVEFTIEKAESDVQVCDVTVPLGPYKFTLRGSLKATREELQRRLDSIPDDELTKLIVVDATVTRAYPRWLPPAQPV